MAVPSHIHAIMVDCDSFARKQVALSNSENRVALGDRKSALLVDDPPPRDILRALCHPASYHPARGRMSEGASHIAVRGNGALWDGSDHLPELVELHTLWWERGYEPSFFGASTAFGSLSLSFAFAARVAASFFMGSMQPPQQT